MDRVVRNSQATLSVTFYNDETAVDATGSVAVVVANSAGTTVSSGNATHGATGVYTYVLPAQSVLDVYTVTWTGTFSGVSQTLTTYVEVVGNRMYSLTEARNSDSSLSDTSRYTSAEIDEARAETEDEFEAICGVAFITRGKRVTLDGSGSSALMLPDARVSSIVSVTMDDVAFTVDELADLSVDEYGELVRTDGAYFTSGSRNVVVVYEYGHTYVPADLRRAALLRQRSRLISAHSGIPDRATSFQPEAGGTYTLATPGRAGFKTGIPDVDAVLARYSYSAPGVF